MTFGSEELSRAFYEALGADGLAARTCPEWDALILGDLAQLLSPRSRILDVGCGYGRIAVPLALAGHRVAGLDLSETMVRAAQTAAEAAGVSIAFVVGSMTEMPYADSSFDGVLCLWSAFHELLHETEQEQALREMWRVLAPGGLAIVEGALYTPPTEHEILAGERAGDTLRTKVNGRGPPIRGDKGCLGAIGGEAGWGRRRSGSLRSPPLRRPHPELFLTFHQGDISIGEKEGTFLPVYNSGALSA